MTKLAFPATLVSTGDHDDRVTPSHIAGRFVSRSWAGYNVARKKTGSAELSAASRLRVCL